MKTLVALLLAIGMIFSVMPVAVAATPPPPLQPQINMQRSTPQPPNGYGNLFAPDVNATLGQAVVYTNDCVVMTVPEEAGLNVTWWVSAANGVLAPFGTMAKWYPAKTGIYSLRATGYRRNGTFFGYTKSVEVRAGKMITQIVTSSLSLPDARGIYTATFGLQNRGNLVACGKATMYQGYAPAGYATPAGVQMSIKWGNLFTTSIPVHLPVGVRAIALIPGGTQFLQTGSPDWNVLDEKRLFIQPPPTPAAFYFELIPRQVLAGQTLPVFTTTSPPPTITVRVRFALTYNTVAKPIMYALDSNGGEITTDATGTFVFPMQDIYVGVIWLNQPTTLPTFNGWIGPTLFAPYTPAKSPSWFMTNDIGTGVITWTAVGYAVDGRFSAF